MDLNRQEDIDYKLVDRRLHRSQILRTRDHRRLAKQAADPLELRNDLNRVRQRLQHIVKAALLMLHGVYTDIEKMLLLVSRVVKGGTPSRVEGFHRQVLKHIGRGIGISNRRVAGSQSAGVAGAFAITPLGTQPP